MGGKLPNFLRILVVFWLASAAAAAHAAERVPPAPSRGLASEALSDIRRYLPAAFELKTAPPLTPIRPAVFSHGPRGENRMALSFDACALKGPSRYDEAIPRILIEKKTPATFFLGGKWMAEHPDATRFLSLEPHFELANHSFLHPHLVQASDERVRQEILWTQSVMFSLTARQATLLRAPYGEYDDRTVRLAAAAGLTLIQFDLPSGDPDPHATRERLIQSVVGKARNGSIVVMHVNGRGWHTADALAEIIDRLHGRGLHLVTVGELIRGMPSPD